ncbi:trypsin-like serine protease [bacterium]|nr:trypsin-like serine protease [bacterium]
MHRITRWFLFGLLLGGAAMGLIYLGAGLERGGVIPDSLNPNVSGTLAYAQAQQQITQDLYAQRRNAITIAIEETSPAVVGITVTQMREFRARSPLYDDPFFRYFFGIPERRFRQPVQNLGSGFIITEDGYVLTNEHVVHGAVEIVVSTSEGRQMPAELIGLDYDTDIALLKVEHDEPLPHLDFADSDDVIVGEWAIAVGNPFGLFEINDKPSVSVGVVSATQRDFERNDTGRLYRGMIQTDAAINQGNSGGPLVNVMGRVIGMNAFIFSQGGGGSIGIGFAIPANMLRNVFEELKSRGKVDRDFWTGLVVQNIDRLIAMSLGFPHEYGVIITDVEEESPADHAELKPTDIIMEIDGTPIRDTGHVRRYFRDHDLRVGDRVKMNIFREGKEQTVYMTLEARPE